MRDGLAGVGIGDATGDDPGRLQCHRHGLRVRRVVGLDVDHLRGESRVGDAQVGLEAAADAMQGEPAIGVGGRRLGPGRQVVHASPPVGRTFEAAHERIRVPESKEDASDGRDRHRDTLGGPALQVEEAPLDHLLGLQPDFGVGLIGVGVELGPADSVTRCQGDGHELVVPRR